MKTNLLIIFCCIMFASGYHATAQLPTGASNIDINNIDALISSSSDLFWDFNNPKFEVPKDSGKHAIFAAGLWMGGVDGGGQLHLAGQTYRQTGIDFWPGPIDSASGTPTSFNLWDRCWKLTAAEIQDHIQNYTIPNYVVPQSIAEWPGYDASLGRVLAPFADYNGNGIYDPANGDYPAILGDMTVYSIYNDLYPHTETVCDPIGVEVHRTTFGFNDPLNTDLNNTIFMRYEIKNYSNQSYNDFYVSKWVDFDLGNATDDYVGTDIGLNMIYCYNGDPDDEGASGYGINPPAVGVYFLNSPLSSSMSYDNTNVTPTGNPSGCAGFRNYTQAIWLDNIPLTYGNNGRDITAPFASYMYPGNTDLINFPALGAWSETTALNPPADRRMIGSSGPYTLAPGGYLSFDIGYTFARADSGGPLASLAELQDAVANLRLQYDNGLLTSVTQPSSSQVSVYPNPATDELIISSKENHITDIRLIDATGRVVSEINNVSGKQSIITKDLARGIYIISIMSKNKFENKKIILK